MFRTNCIMHFLRSSSVCVLPRYFFRCARIKLLYIDINGIASYRIAIEYIDISYKLDIPPSPSWGKWIRGKIESVFVLLQEFVIGFIYNYFIIVVLMIINYATLFAKTKQTHALIVHDFTVRYSLVDCSCNEPKFKLWEQKYPLSVFVLYLFLMICIYMITSHEQECSFYRISAQLQMWY